MIKGILNDPIFYLSIVNKWVLLQVTLQRIILPRLALL